MTVRTLTYSSETDQNKIKAERQRRRNSGNEISWECVGKYIIKDQIRNTTIRSEIYSIEIIESGLTNTRRIVEFSFPYCKSTFSSLRS